MRMKDLKYIFRAYIIIAILTIFPLWSWLIPSSATSQINVNFTVTDNGFVTIYLSGIPSNNTVILHYGIESGPQQAWTSIYNANMNWNGRNFSVTIGPFNNGTWIAWVFYDNTTNQWINYF